MGKTARGAIWLDGNRLSPYDFYQFWVNTEDADVERFLKIYTFLPIEQIRELGQMQGAEIRRAKETLAYEVTRLTHGEEEAERAREAARSLFGGAGDSDAIPTTTLDRSALAQGLLVTDLLERVGLVKSRSEARRLIQQGGVSINDRQISAVDHTLTSIDLDRGALLIRVGKKRYHRVAIA